MNIGTDLSLQVCDSVVSGVPLTGAAHYRYNLKYVPNAVPDDPLGYYWKLDLPSFSQYASPPTLQSQSNGKMLWRNTSGIVTLWTIDDQGSRTGAGKEYDPGDGWTPVNYSDGKILWRHTSGIVTLWTIDEQGNRTGAGKEYDPGAGWTPVNYSNGKILWRHTSGIVTLWTVDDQGNKTIDGKQYDPGANWTPVNYSK